jgi:uncharacterized protein (TIGR03435 family)
LLQPLRRYFLITGLPREDADEGVQETLLRLDNITDGRTADLSKGMPLGGAMKNLVLSLRRNMAMFDPLEGQNVQQDMPPILDETGLAGEYDILLKIDQHEDWPALLEHQLGLKLELRKMPVEMLVFESAARPSGN